MNKSSMSVLGTNNKNERLKPRINNHFFLEDNNAWSKKQWFLWLALPLTIINLVVILVFLLNNKQLNEIGYWIVQIDWFLALNNIFYQVGNKFWLNLTILGDASVLLPLLSPLIIFRPAAFAAIIGSVPLATIFARTGKSLFSIPRPSAVLDHADFNIVGELLLGNNSFPSGHSLTVVAVFIAILAVLFPKPKTSVHFNILIISFLFAILLCLSRVAVGAHWPFDLLIGGSLGWISGLSGALLVRRYKKWWQVWIKSDARFAISTILILSSVYLTPQLFGTGEYSISIFMSIISGGFTAFFLAFNKPFLASGDAKLYLKAS